MQRFFLVFLLTIGTLSTGFSQKYGHVNFGNLLSAMPEVKTAEAELQAYEKEQVAIGEDMVKKLNAAFEDAQKRRDDLTPKELAAIEAKLQKDQVAIRQFEQQLPMKIEKKRQTLLGPIIQRAKDAVTAVAKAGSYKLVFDSSIFGTILFAGDTTDLTPEVKAKLGMQ